MLLSFEPVGLLTLNCPLDYIEINPLMFLKKYTASSVLEIEKQWISMWFTALSFCQKLKKKNSPQVWGKNKLLYVLFSSFIFKLQNGPHVITMSDMKVIS